MNTRPPPRKFGHRLWWRLLLASGLLGAGPVFAQSSAKAPNEKALALRAEARSYEHGEGVPRDPVKASALYCEAARLGDTEAQYNLGWMYANARGVPRDDGLAAYFLSLAAKQGDAQAERMLRYLGDPVSEPPGCMATPEEETSVFENPTPAQQQVMALVHKLAPQYGVSPRLALAVIRAESNFNPAAVSNKNAQGLMQLIPETAARFNVAKPFDPEQNIRGGLSYLRWLLAYFKGDVALVAAGYNAGEGAVNRYAGIPPYAETQGYVKRIKQIFTKDEHPFDPAVTEPSPDLHRIRARRLM